MDSLEEALFLFPLPLQKYFTILCNYEAWKVASQPSFLSCICTWLVGNHASLWLPMLIKSLINSSFPSYNALQYCFLRPNPSHMHIYRITIYIYIYIYIYNALQYAVIPY